MKKILQLILISIFIFNIQSIDAQIENWYVIKAPNEKFQEIKLQQHKNLPRIGRINTYGVYRSGYCPPTTRITYSKRKVLMDKTRIAAAEIENYLALLKMKSLRLDIDQMDKNLPYNLKNSNKKAPNDDAHKQYKKGQEHFKYIAITLTTDEEYKKYFGPIENDGYRNQSIKWGGYQASEFEQAKNYNDFVKYHLEDLQNYANNLIDEVYLIFTLEMGEYDFVNSGFPLKIGGTQSNYRPYTNRIWPYNHTNKPLFKVPMANAEQLLTRVECNHKSQGPIIFGAFKVKYKCEGNMDFDLTSSMVELFGDEALTDKIGEINIQIKN